MMATTNTRATRGVLIVSEGHARSLRGLLDEAPLETACFLVVGQATAPDGSERLTVKEVIPVAAEDYLLRTEVALTLAPGCVARAMWQARRDQLGLLLVHTHPFPGVATPSITDRSGEAVLMPAVRRRVGSAPVGRVIIGQHSIHAARLGEDVEHELQVWEVGNGIQRWHDLTSSTVDATDDVHERQVRAFGVRGQRLLRDLRVAIIGLGGTGSVVAQQLAHLGVGDLTLIDPDAIEETNLNRVVGARRSDVGRAKVDVAQDLVKSVRPETIVQAFRADIRDAATARTLLATDCFVCCTDSHGSRAVLNQLAYQYLLPGIDLGVAIRAANGSVSHISGRVQLLGPGQPCLDCSSVLDPELVRRELLDEQARAADPYIVGGPPNAAPAVISINSAVASLGVTMLVSAVTGIRVETRNQRLRLESGVVSRVEVVPVPTCPTCSPIGRLARAESWPSPGRT